MDPDLESPMLRLLREERAALDAATPAPRADFIAHARATREALDRLREELEQEPVASRGAGDPVPAAARGTCVRTRLDELDARLRRVERHLDLPPLDARGGRAP